MYTVRHKFSSLNKSRKQVITLEVDPIVPGVVGRESDVYSGSDGVEGHRHDT
jgi:hypothetical protein